MAQRQGMQEGDLSKSHANEARSGSQGARRCGAVPAKDGAKRFEDPCWQAEHIGVALSLFQYRSYDE